MRAILSILFLAIGATTAHATDGTHTVYDPQGSYSGQEFTLSTTPQNILAANPSRVHFFLQNLDGSISIACRWGTAAAAPASVGQHGWQLIPGAARDDPSAGVNPLALNCVAASGSPIITVEQY